MRDDVSAMAYGGAFLNSAAQARTRANGAVCVIIRAEAQEGAEEALEALLSDFAYEVRAAERGCTSYVVSHALGAPRHFAAHVRFADFGAFKRHGVTPHMTRTMPRLNALLASPVSLEIFVEM